MPETFFRFRASELTTLRVICRGPTCGAVLELPITRLLDMAEVVKCPACGGVLQHGGNHNLVELAKALHKFAALDYVDVEFSLPVKE